LQYAAASAAAALSLTAAFGLSSSTVSIAFPSLAFFEALQREVAAERERFSRLGFFDTTFGIRVLRDGPPAEYTVAFEVFDCVRVAEGIAAGVDFVIEGRLDAWREMLDSIHELGAADTAHSLNTLTHFGERLAVRYDDPDGHDKLYRFAESVQEWLDLSARLDFAYPDGTAPPARREALRRIAR
jgi:hypothetical protein